jgi:hypothetical protein
MDEDLSYIQTDYQYCENLIIQTDPSRSNNVITHLENYITKWMV